MDLLARIKDKDWRVGNTVSDSDFFLLGKEIELDISKLMKDGNLAETEGKGPSKLLSIISDALSNDCKAITPIVTISYNLELRLRLSFDSPKQMGYFLQRNQQTRLWAALEQCR